MYKIVVVGDDRKEALSHIIYTACASCGSVSWANEKQTVVNFCIASDKQIDCYNHYDIMVLGDNLNTLRRLPYADICILDSSNQHAVTLAHSHHLTALTCSMSPYDTLTADSIADCGNILVSLQRDIVTPNGKIIEPQDFLLHLEHEMPLYPMLASCAVLICCGQNPSENRMGMKF